jgi:hypothetical protein
MPLLLLAIVVLFNWKLTLTRQFTWLEHPDGVNQVMPWFQFQAIEWHSFRIPAWDPYEWIGQPLFGQGQPGAAYPFNWLLFLMPMSMAHIAMAALNWYMVLIRYAGALACYALCRDLRCSRAGSVLGASVFALGGFVANTGWPQWVNGAVWAPLAFLFLLRVERGERPVANSILSGFFLGFAWLSGHHQAPLYTGLAATAVWIGMALRGKRLDLGVVRLAALSLIIAVMASAFQTFPMAEYLSRSVRWIGMPDPIRASETVPYQVHEQYSLKPAQLPSIFLPVSGTPSNPFIGVAAFSFAVLGVICAWRERHTAWLAALAAAAILFAQGPNGLLHGIFYSLAPFVDKAREPGAAVAVFAVCVAPLAALGFDRVLGAHGGAEALAANWPRRGALALAGFGALFLVRTFLFTDNQWIVPAVLALAVAALITARRAGAISARAGSILAILLVLYELSSVANAWLVPYGPNSERTPLLNNLGKHGDIARFLLDRGDAGRIEYHESDIPYNFGDWYGLPTFEAYTASVLKNLWQHQIFRPEVRDILGIRYSIAKQPERPGQRLLFTGQSGLSVYENPSAFPRVWTVHEEMPVADAQAAREMLASAAFDARKQVFFAGSEAPQLSPCADDSGDEVRLSSYRPNHVAIAATLACPGLVILSDAFYPGWRATVDGQPVKIQEADGVFRGVAAPAGEHRIEMRYRPASVIGGAALSLLAALIAAAALIRAHSRVGPASRRPSQWPQRNSDPG